MNDDKGELVSQWKEKARNDWTAPLAPDLSELSDASDKLTVHGVETRYPGEWYPVSSAEMNEVVEISRKFGELLLPKL